MLRNVAGILLVVLGILGLFLPFLQGILFLVIGLALIDIPLKRRIHDRLHNRYGWYRRIAHRHHQIQERVHRWWTRKERGRNEDGAREP